VTKHRKQKFKIETAGKLLRVAKDDLYVAEILITAPKCRPETVLYHAQQSVEKAIKAVTIHFGQSVVLTHDLDLLISELPGDLTIALPSEVGELTQYATIRRYLDGDELIEIKDLQAAIDVGRIFIKWAELLVK
jgi:HEPN domain-containing protein